MADNLIPEPQIQATNIPTGGGAQVRFDFVAPDNAFANLSKTIASASQTMVNFNQLEENERKAKESLQEGLAQIHGLTETGQLSEAEYMKIQRELNGKAQSEGVIRANENWFTITETQKQRSNIRIKALGAALETTGAIDRMSNPNEGLASTWDEEYGGLLESMGTESMGTDSQGNEVYLDLENMTPMELVAFAQGQSALEAATKLAVDENKHNRQIEANTAKMESDLYEEYQNFNNLKDQYSKFGGYAENTLEILKKDHIQRIADIINIGYNAGVKEINSRVLNSITSWSTKYMENIDPSDDAALAEANSYLDFIQQELILRDDILFAKEGTENYNKVQKIRESMESEFATAQRSYNASLPNEEAKFALWIDQQLREQDMNELQTEDAQIALRNKIEDEAFKRGIPYEAKYKNRVNSFLDDRLVDDTETELVSNWDRKLVKDQFISDSDFKSLEDQLYELRVAGSDGISYLTQDEYEDRLNALDRRYSRHKGEERKRLQEQRDQYEASFANISKMNADDELNKLRRSIQNIDGSAYEEILEEPNAHLVNDMVTTLVTIQKGLESKQGAIPPNEGYTIQVKRAADLFENPDQAKSVIESHLERIRKGLDFSTATEDDAMQYMQSKRYINSVLALLTTQTDEALSAEIILNPSDYATPSK